VSIAAAGLASPAGAQQTGVGVVTNLTGSATVARTSNTQPLRFKDSVYGRDRIVTAEKSLLRVLLGGKAIVTMRELSELTITDAGGFAGLELSGGRMGLSVARQLMAPGETVQISTPNAVASVQGSVVIAEVSGGRGAGAVSLFNVLSGPVEVVAGGASVNVGSRQRVRVSGGTLGPVEDLSPEDVSRLAAQLKSAEPQHTDVANEFQQELTAREQTRALSKPAPKTSVLPVDR
jgi:FecR protein